MGDLFRVYYSIHKKGQLPKVESLWRGSEENFTWHSDDVYSLQLPDQRKAGLLYMDCLHGLTPGPTWPPGNSWGWARSRRERYAGDIRNYDMLATATTSWTADLEGEGNVTLQGWIRVTDYSCHRHAIPDAVCICNCGIVCVHSCILCSLYDHCNVSHRVHVFLLVLTLSCTLGHRPGNQEQDSRIWVNTGFKSGRIHSGNI